MDGRTDEDWGMYTPEGNHLVETLVSALVTDMRSPHFTRPMVEPSKIAIMRQVKIAGHTEVYDTAVRECIYAEIDAVCDERGWPRLDE